MARKPVQYFLLIVTVAIFVGAGSYLRYTDFVKKTTEIAVQSNVSVSANIAVRISGLRRQVSLFADNQGDQLRHLARNPTDRTAYAQLQEDLQKHFPSYFAATVADESGVALLEGLDRFVGNGYRRDILAYSKAPDDHNVYVHSSPEHRPYHFDTMVPFEYESGKTGTFFVSFYASSIATILADMQVKGQHLFLLRRKPGVALEKGHDAYIIEIAAEGPRDVLSRPPHLSAVEWDRILSFRPAPETQWMVASLPEPTLFPLALRRIALEGGVLSLVLLVLGILLVRRIGQVNLLSLESAELERRVSDQTKTLRGEIVEREAAQQALEDLNQVLEKRVEARTEDLRAREVAPRESESRFRDFAQASADWFWELDEDLCFSYLSPNVERITGKPAEWYLGKSLHETIRSAGNVEIFDFHIANLKKRAPFRDFVRQQSPYEGDDLRWVSIGGSPIFDKSGAFRGYRGTGRDVTEQRAVEEQLRQSQKMEIVGQLTGGGAHDFNNLLAIITGSLDFLEDEFSEGSDQRALLDSAIRATMRGGELTSRLLAFSRRQTLQPDQVNLNALLPDIIELLKRSLGEAVDFKMVLAENLWATKLDQGQLETALVNLAVNAGQAMPEGGRLTIQTRNVTVTTDDPDRPDDLKPGYYVALSVADTGIGMSDSEKSRAFEPFFTTKDVGQGSGLGLSMVHGFAHQSGGHVSLRSEEGDGATVELLFLALDVAWTEKPAPEDAAIPPGAGQKILIVEDNEDLRILAVKMVRDLGYQVLEAANGAAALEILEGPDGIDLLFTDIILPGGLNGGKLAELARAHRPGLRVLYTSGFAETAGEGELDPNIDLVAKPYRRQMVARQLAAALKTSPD
ncbi:MAG: PAS domain S-box-containing protein [Alphaproteobacteria bacterium]|jgi:PAS domain S-box-containing protein